MRALHCLAPFLMASSAAAQILVPALPPGRIVSAVPPWMATEEPGLEEARDKVLGALTLLRGSATGRTLLTELGVGRVLIEKDGSLMVTDGSRTIFAGANFVADYPEDVLAMQMAHELEHLRQISLGVTGQDNRSLRELAAVLVQTRVWVELGGTVHAEHWKENRANSWDMTGALDYPNTALAAIAARAGHQLAYPVAAGEKYWKDTLAEDARWRKAWGPRFPRGRDSKEAALKALRQAARFMDKPPAGQVSDALPAAIEAAVAGDRTALDALSPLERALGATVLTP
jgi:hypothetical protein